MSAQLHTLIVATVVLAASSPLGFDVEPTPGYPMCFEGPPAYTLYSFTVCADGPDHGLSHWFLELCLCDADPANPASACYQIYGCEPECEVEPGGRS